ncbi:MAG: asparagine synthase (glutamine-hydrolyzing) [Helicobacteraceae bacterium]|jgi:asparagine synthase (glutamine-hydrolysing)|nr:asparagine synthase (glutamine-hydrolyzing) [Helicobacteraceae bacterium]
MCGIAGFYGRSYEKAQKLLAKLNHRGPDENGIFESDFLTLVHSRLAILDVAGGKQPMTRENLTIVFNGEIYNHLELRIEFGDVFKTRSDTETILFLYEKYREKMLEKLDGMFAIAIYDFKEKTLFLARDRYGKKPLCYSFKNGFCFASEINALREIADFTIERDAIASYLALGFTPFEHSAFAEVKKLSPAEWLKLRLDTFEIRSGKFFNAENHYEGAIAENAVIRDEAAAMEAVEIALKNSVKSRLISSDFEVGAFLSGGIDSALVSFYAAEVAKNLKTFTIKFAGAFDETALAAKTARKIASDHAEIKVAPENLADEILQILPRFGEPFCDSSAIPSYFVARAAKERVKVVLNGDGADELFAGYRRYLPIARGWFGAARRAAFLRRFLPPPRDKMSGYNYIYRLLDSASARAPLDFWRKTRTSLPAPLDPANPIAAEVSRFLVELPPLSPLSLALLSDQALLLSSDLLPKIDITSMARSLEVRSPFLSREISLLAPRLADNLKVRGKQMKYILRRLAAKNLGAEIANAPKRGFEAPLADWIEGDLREVVWDFVGSPNAFWREFLPQNILEKRMSRIEKTNLIWTIFCLEVWKKTL